MGGSFRENAEKIGRFNPKEFNIAQDENSARETLSLCPTDIVFIPFEVGAEVIAEVYKRDEPLWDCMKAFADAAESKYDDVIRNFSFDPITVMAALERDEWKFEFSKRGDVEITAEGEAVFKPNPNGKSSYVSTKTNLKDIREKLNDYIKGDTK